MTAWSSPSHEDQPKQVEALVAKRGATSATRSNTDYKTLLCKLSYKLVPTTCTSTTNLFCDLQKNHVKEHQKSLRMSSKNEPSGSQNKPQSQTIEEVLVHGIPFNKGSFPHERLNPLQSMYRLFFNIAIGTRNHLYRDISCW